MTVCCICIFRMLLIHNFFLSRLHLPWLSSHYCALSIQVTWTHFNFVCNPINWIFLSRLFLSSLGKLLQLSLRNRFSWRQQSNENGNTNALETTSPHWWNNWRTVAVVINQTTNGALAMRNFKPNWKQEPHKNSNLNSNPFSPTTTLLCDTISRKSSW